MLARTRLDQLDRVLVAAAERAVEERVEPGSPPRLLRGVLARRRLHRDELEVLRKLIGKDATVERVEHLLDGARRCAYRIQGAE